MTIRLITCLLTLIALPASLNANSAPTIITRPHRGGVNVANSNALKRWLAKMPVAFDRAKHREVKISNIDLKWKQTRTVRKVASALRSREKTTYKCTLNLTIQYQDATYDEGAPEQIAKPDPVTINSRCDVFLAATQVPNNEEPDAST